MDVRLRRVAGLLRLGRTTDAAEAAVEAREEAGQPPLAAVSIAARLASAGAKTLCGGVAEEEALDELAELRVCVCALCYCTCIDLYQYTVFFFSQGMFCTGVCFLR